MFEGWLPSSLPAHIRKKHFEGTRADSEIFKPPQGKGLQSCGRPCYMHPDIVDDPDRVKALKASMHKPPLPFREKDYMNEKLLAKWNIFPIRGFPKAFLAYQQ